MVMKRQLGRQEDDVRSEVPTQEPKRRPISATIAKDVMQGLSPQEFVTQLEPLLEPLFRRVLQEELKHSLQLFNASLRSSQNHLEFEPYQARAWQLHFDDKLPSTLFTGSRIESEDRNPVKIAILDATSKKVITSGPLSSLKVEIVVLDGDFGADEQEDWTQKEFNTRIVHERKGKRPLVTGELVIALRDGVGSIGDICFTDNSSWIRSRRFRLGARPLHSISTGVRVREARSETFVVKDHRGESYKKHHPPTLSDEIWRLERISKDGAFHRRLAGKGITTVKDFLRLCYVDPSSLRNVLGGGISNKTWETIIEHANACVLDDKLYMYYRDAERVGLLFNSIFKVVGATFDGQNYQSLDKLNVLQMGLVEQLKIQAYNNVSDLVPVEEPSAFGPPMLSSSLLADVYCNPSSDLQLVNSAGVHQDELEMQPASKHLAPLPHAYDIQDGSQLQCHLLQTFTPTMKNSLITPDSSSGPYDGVGCWSPGGSWGTDMQIGHLTVDDNSPTVTSPWRGNEFFLPPTYEVGIASTSNCGIHTSRNGKPKSRWCMIRAAMKWGISVRRYVAAKRRARARARAFYVDF